ncbi:hypothetical protein JI747_018835 [Chryseobacterium sp. RG1]|uniref:YD repeat-containing protein n=1 Tax=Chryseobacterium tagetis TaxID=2801334 RepID=A0ABS8A6X5_9FLAO|nr:hypothetical protein [Chryseobacterium tagetis]MCA6069227.1 hypothetical protein [Chryseobacterium tagetis]
MIPNKFKKVFRYIIAIFLFCLSSNFLKAQINSNNQLLEPLNIMTPEAANFAKYGGIPINLSTGQLNHSILLYNIKVGSFEIPLSLNYSYNGFKPQVDPSMVGIGWSSNFGGAVVREVKGKPDETNGYFANINQYENMSNLSTSQQVLMLKNAVNYGYDTRPDKYIVNAPGIKGSFTHNSNLTPIFFEKSNYKISQRTQNAFDPFVVTNENGIIYTFNEPEVTTNLDWQTNIDDVYPSSWMLSKIEIPERQDSIKFSYENYQSYKLFSNFVWSTTIPQWSCYTPPPAGNTYNDAAVSGKCLKRIDYPDGYVLFDYEKLSRNTSEFPFITLMSNFLKLQSVRVYDKANKQIEKFSFNYYDSGFYYVLSSIKKEDRDGVEIPFYEFDYINKEQLPVNPVSYEYQDLWGFYNQQPININNMTAALSPSFLHSKLGALSKITYPTKGRTEIDYLPNTISEYVSNPPVQDQEILSFSSQQTVQDCDYREMIVNIPTYQEVTITLVGTNTATNGYINMGVKNENGNILQFVGSNGYLGNFQIMSNFLSQNPTQVVSGSTFVTAGQNLKLYIDLCKEGGGSQEEVSCYIIINYVNSTNPTGQYVDKEVGGIRVSSTKDCPDSSSDNCVKKTYTYSDGFLIEPYAKKLLEKTTNFTDVEALNYTELNDGDYSVQSSGASECSYGLKQSFYRPIGSLTNSGSHIFYPKVDVSNDSDKTLGNIKNQFEYYLSPSVSDSFPDLKPNEDHRQSKLKLQVSQEKLNTVLVDKKEILNYYNEKTYNDIYAFDAMYDRSSNQIRYYKVDCTNGNCHRTGEMAIKSTLDSFVKGSIKHFSKSYNIDSTSIKEMENSKILQTFKKFKYNNDNTLKEEITTFPSNEEAKNVFFYPKDLINEPFMTNLVDENRISTVVKNESFKNNKKIKEEHLKFNNDIDTSGKTRLKSLFSSIGNVDIFSSDDLIINFNKYDDKGNILQYTSKDGIPTTIVWGYNQTQPIAKIVGAAYSDVSSVISTIVNASNTDAQDPSTEPALIAALDNFRKNSNIANFQTTTYTYDPLIGVTSITPPSGIREVYIYDSVNRLKEIREQSQTGKLLKEYQYNYKH